MATQAPLSVEAPLQPRLLVLGAQKGGTTSIFDLLKSAGLVCGHGGLPPFDMHEKEAHMFDRIPENFAKATSQEYNSYYDCEYGLDATPNYLFDLCIPDRMRAMQPTAWFKSVRMLAILREPIARDLSMFNMVKSVWWNNQGSDSTDLGTISQLYCTFSPGSFPTYQQGCACKIADWRARCLKQAGGDALRAADLCAYTSNQTTLPNRFANGMYARHVSRFLALVPRNQLMPINFDAMLAAQQIYIAKVVHFFGLPSASPLKRLPTANALDFPGKVTKISCATRDDLWSVFSPSNSALYRLLGSTASAASSHEPPFEHFDAPACGDGEADYVQRSLPASAEQAAGIASGHAQLQGQGQRQHGGKGRVREAGGAAAAGSRALAE